MENLRLLAIGEGGAERLSVGVFQFAAGCKAAAEDGYFHMVALGHEQFAYAVGCVLALACRRERKHHFFQSVLQTLFNYFQ